MAYDFVPVIPSLHEQLLLNGPVPTPVPMGPYIEIPTPFFWPPGYATGKHKLTNTVRHHGLSIALDGHDIGPAILHIPIPLNDTLFPLHTLKSSRKAMFSAGEVKANGKAVACCTMIDWGIVPTPMKACSKIPDIVLGSGMSVLLNSLIVGMHFVDLIAGYATIVVSLVIDRLGHHFEALEEHESLTEQIPGLVGGLVRLAGQEWAGYRGDAGVTFEVTHGVEVRMSRSGTDHRWSGTLEVQQDFSGGLGAIVGHGEVTVREGAGDEGPEVEGRAGVNIFSDGSYEGEVNSDGEVSGEAEHPTGGLDTLFGAFSPEGGPGADNPLDGGFIPSWDDLPSL